MLPFSNVFFDAKFHWTWIKLKPYQKYFPHFSFFVNSHSLCRLHKYFSRFAVFRSKWEKMFDFCLKCRFQVDRFMFIISEINDWRTKRTKTIPNWLKGIHFSFIKPTDEIKKWVIKCKLWQCKGPGKIQIPHFRKQSGKQSPEGHSCLLFNQFKLSCGQFWTPMLQGDRKSWFKNQGVSKL